LFRDCNEPPWVFLRVCSRWKQVALGEHRLWRSLKAQLPLHGINGTAIRECLHKLWSHNKTLLVSLDLRSPLSLSSFDQIMKPYSSRLLSLTVTLKDDVLVEWLQRSLVGFDHLEFVCLKWWPSPKFAAALRKKPIIAFSTAPRLQKVEFIGCDDRILPETILTLPWSHITHITFSRVSVPLLMVYSILRSCDNLVHLELHRQVEEAVTLMNPPGEIDAVHTNVQHLILAVSFNEGIQRFLRPLVMPFLKTFTIRHQGQRLALDARRMLFLWPQNEFNDMLKRSGCNIEVLSLKKCRPCIIPLKDLLNALPSLVNLDLDDSAPVTGSIFRMMMRGEILPKLQKLSCYTNFPRPALDFFKHYISSTGSNQDTLHAEVMCDPNGDGYDDAFEEYSLLATKMQGKGVFLFLEKGY
jgi:hypothetical protein